MGGIRVLKVTNVLIEDCILTLSLQYKVSKKTDFTRTADRANYCKSSLQLLKHDMYVLSVVSSSVKHKERIWCTSLGVLQGFL